MHRSGGPHDRLSQDGLQRGRIAAARIRQVDLVVTTSGRQSAGRQVLLMQALQCRPLVVVGTIVQELTLRPSA